MTDRVAPKVRDSGIPAAPSLTPPPTMKATRVDVGGEEFVVLRWELPPPSISGLSRAEAEVARLVLQGCSNAVIAFTRRSSAGTVAKQVACVFRKLGVRSRSELSAAAASGDLGSRVPAHAPQRPASDRGVLRADRG
jgi:DNA-binding CsgD family transcriptional regulator